MTTLEIIAAVVVDLDFGEDAAKGMNLKTAIGMFAFG